jgi:hypothetical protein
MQDQTTDVKHAQTACQTPVFSDFGQAQQYWTHTKIQVQLELTEQQRRTAAATAEASRLATNAADWRRRMCVIEDAEITERQPLLARLRQCEVELADLRRHRAQADIRRQEAGRANTASTTAAVQAAQLSALQRAVAIAPDTVAAGRPDGALDYGLLTALVLRELQEIRGLLAKIALELK